MATSKARFSVSAEQISLIQLRMSGPAPSWISSKLSEFRGGRVDETYTHVSQPVDSHTAGDVGVQWHLKEQSMEDYLHAGN